MSGPKLSTAQAAYESIRRKVLTFGLLPGQHVNEVVLADELKISRTPLREALNRLVAEGLFAARERGFSIPDLNPATVQQLFEARIEVESGLVRLACERASEAEIQALAEFVDVSAAESPDVSVDRLVELDCHFHESIARMSRNNELLRILKNLNDRIHLIRWIKMEGKRAVTQDEHRQIMEAIRRREAPEAERLMRAHILHRTDEILAAIRNAYAHVHTVQFAGMEIPGQAPAGPRARRDDVPSDAEL